MLEIVDADDLENRAEQLDVGPVLHRGGVDDGRRDERPALVAADQMLAGKMVGHVRRIIERHPLCAALIPEGNEAWAADRFTVQRPGALRDPSMLAQGLLGNITQGRTLLQLVESPQQRAFGQAKLDTLPAYCRACDVRFACNGGCPKDRFLTTPDGELGLHYLCEGYQAFFRHVDQPMKVMANLLSRGADATGLREWYAAQDAAHSSAPSTG